MYSNERKNGFSILDLLVKIIFAAIFIFILVWLFQKKIPNINLNPFYSNVFRENIKYMQEAGEGYFTTDKLPQNVGESVKLTLDEMEKMNIILPFVDKDGNACNKTESYVSITKLADDQGYELKTNLVCNKESNYTTKTLGCHVYCPNNGVKCDCNCNGEKSCTYTKVTQYQFKKLVKGTKTTYSCDKGSTLKGKYCYKFELKDSKSALVKKTTEKTLTQDAQLVKTDATYKQLATVTSTSKKQLTTVVTTTKKQLTTVVSTTPSTTKQEPYTCTKTKTVQKCEDKTKQEPYSCTKTRTVNKCTTEYKKEGYSCNCSTKFVGGVLKTVCDTCYKTVSYQSCKDVNESYTDTCYRNVTYKDCKDVNESYTDTCYRTVTVPGTTTYSCPSGTDSKEGSGANLKCYQTVKTYSCPSGTDSKEGSGANLKCYQTVTTYSCPSGTDYKEGSGANLKCYKIISGSAYYKCKDSSYTLSGTKCYKVVKETVTVKECPKDYKLEGNKCNLYKETKVKAKATTKEGSHYEYKWSTSKTLKGWTATGKTRKVNGEKVCK
jgi:hypothetical protein